MNEVIKAWVEFKDAEGDIREKLKDFVYSVEARLRKARYILGEEFADFYLLTSDDKGYTINLSYTAKWVKFEFLRFTRNSRTSTYDLWEINMNDLPLEFVKMIRINLPDKLDEFLNHVYDKANSEELLWLDDMRSLVASMQLLS